MKTMNSILVEVENIIKENEALKSRVADLELANRNLSMRERLYQSALGNTKTQLMKLAQGIDTTPHSRDTEYQRTVYGEELNSNNTNW